jgi:NADH:ubiquinone oxidoreductase subunit K
MLQYLALFSIALFAIGIAGMVSSKHFLVMILSIELSLIAATTFVISFYSGGYSGYAMVFLFAVWAIAAVEAISLIIFYQELIRRGMGLDVTKMSKIRD